MSGLFAENASTCYLTSAYLCKKPVTVAAWVFHKERLNVLLDFGLSLQKACGEWRRDRAISQRTPHRCRLTSAYLCETACADGWAADFCKMPVECVE